MCLNQVKRFILLIFIFLCSSNEVFTQDGSKLNFRNGEVYLVKLNFSEPDSSDSEWIKAKKPIGKNANLTYDTFFKSINIEYVGPDAYSSSPNKEIELEFMKKSALKVFYKSEENYFSTNSIFELPLVEADDGTYWCRFFFEYKNENKRKYYDAIQVEKLEFTR